MPPDGRILPSMAHLTTRYLAAVSLLALALAFAPAYAAETQKKNDPPTDNAPVVAATRLQVFLDRAEFAPGKIDGRYGEFTLKALALYRESRGENAAPVTNEPDATPDVSGLDLASIDPLFLSYTVSEADVQKLGPVPKGVPAQAKLKALPYETAAEAIAEKFHTTVDYLNELNPDKIKDINAGDTLSVPNVEPFELSTVKEMKPGSPLAANDIEDDTEEQPEESKTTVRIDSETSMLTVLEDGRLIAAYPVTIGSKQTESPIGDWKVRGVAMMPNFRYDKAMLKKGERSANFHILPPGPNNPVGVIWIALNKKGIGLHGTNDPDSIGRSASHGCVRLANWDVVRLAQKIKAGVPVVIH